MTGIELDSTKLTVLMVSGGIFAAFALYLFARPPSHGAAKIELFGLKFESSSAAIIVFLVGVGLLAAPVWLEEVAQGEPSAPEGNAPRQVSAGGNQARLLPSGPDSKEAEPNNSFREANQIQLGSIISARGGDADWYLIPTDPDLNELVEIKILPTHDVGGIIYAYTYNARNEQLNQLTVGGGASFENVASGNQDRIYVEVKAGSRQSYEISARLKEE